MTFDQQPSAIFPADHQHRLDALNPARSVCVTAPAGSGKTELLSQRVLRLLACVDQPEEILAITFTRKAAGEMHHRIIEALIFASSHEQPSQPHKQLSWQLARSALARNEERGWQLLENPGRLKIQTIDSLCASLTRQMPVLSNFGAQPQVTDQIDTVYRQAIHQFLEALERGGIVAEALTTLLSHVDNDYSRLERLLINMLQRRDQWLLHIGIGGDTVAAKQRLEQTLQCVIQDTLSSIASKLKPAAPELLPLFDYAGCNIQWQRIESPIGLLAGCMALPPASADALDEWNGVIDLLLVKPPKVQFRQRLDKNCGFPTETQDGDKQLAKQLKEKMSEQLAILSDDEQLLAALAECRFLPDANYCEQQWQLIEALLILLPNLVAELTLIFQQTGAVDYTQISLAALDALGESLNPSELALRLDHRLRHILIDEFQDTSSTQFRLLEKLTDGWAEHNEASPDNPNTLFLVGDGMQSIYGFREANVGLFLEARKYGVNAITLDDLPLSVNFRSDPKVVDANNLIFSAAFPPRENLARGAVPYECAIAYNSAGEDSDLAVVGFTGDEARAQEASYVVDLIEQANRSDPQGSIAVLVRNRSHLQSVISELSRRGLSWNATDIDSLNSYACIIDLLTLTKAISNLADRLSWAALLRTPWFGLTNADLHPILNRSAVQPVWQLMSSWEEVAGALSSFARERLALQLPRLHAAISDRQRFTLRESVEGLWVALGGPAALSDRREFEMVDSYLEFLEQHQVGGTLVSLTDFEQAVQKLYAKPQQVDSNLHLMTIHKSKGLEFDTVVLPGLARSPRSQDKALMMWREYLSTEGALSGLLFSPLPAAGQQDRIYEHLRFEAAQAQSLENTRLLYVAATRAVKRLYLTFCSEFDDKTGEPKSPRKDSLLANAWSAVEPMVSWQAPVAIDPGQMALGLDQHDSRRELRRLSAQWRLPNWSFPNPLKGFYLNSDFGANNLPEQQKNLVPSAIGTVVHSLFEAITERGTSFWYDFDLSRRSSWLHSMLAYHGLSEAECASALPSVEQAVTNTLDDAAGRWLLSKGDDSVDFTELSVSSYQEGVIRHRTVDRILYDQQGTLWIVDYKTGQPLAGETRQQFIDRESEQYRAQLLDYKWHISQLAETHAAFATGAGDAGCAAIKLGLYFTALPLLHEIS